MRDRLTYPGCGDARPEDVDPALVLTVKQVMQYLGLSRPSVYKALRRGDIPSRRVIGAWLIPKAEFFCKFGWPPPSDDVPTTGAAFRRRRTRSRANLRLIHRISQEIPRFPRYCKVAHRVRGVISHQKVPVKGVLDSGHGGEMTTSGYVTTQKAAELLDCKDRYVREHHCARGDLRYRKKGKVYLIELRSIHEFLARSTAENRRP